MDVTVYGSDGNDYFNLNVNRTDDYTGNWTLVMGAGNDSLGAAALINGDSVDMGAGDDSVALMINSHTPTVAGLSLVKLDGGAGSDWLDFLNFTNTAEISLSTGGATNFENISGSGGSETSKGDANANILTGAGGTDILYGYAGNDILAGSYRGTTTLSRITNWDSDTYSWNNADNAGNNTLYGGAGDDKLSGGYYDDTLDGGTGTDTLSGGNGNDTFVLRTGYGSTTLANANVITDFSDGADVISMDGVDYGDLTIAQGTGAYASHTLVSVTATGEYLLIIQNTTESDITDLDFTAVDISESSIDAASALTAENNPLGTFDPETLTADMTLPESAPIDDSSSFFSEEDTLSLLSELIDLNPSALIDDESLLLANLGDLAPSAQPATEYSVETTDLVADLPMADYYDDMMNYDILVGVSELG